MLEAGAPAPRFDLAAHDGSRVTLDDLAGRWFVIWWYPKASTGG